MWRGGAAREAVARGAGAREAVARGAGATPRVEGDGGIAARITLQYSVLNSPTFNPRYKAPRPRIKILPSPPLPRTPLLGPQEAGKPDSRFITPNQVAAIPPTPVSPYPKPRIKIHGRILKKVSHDSVPVTCFSVSLYVSEVGFGGRWGMWVFSSLRRETLRTVGAFPLCAINHPLS
jgi:hypothetical protein